MRAGERVADAGLGGHRCDVRHTMPRYQLRHHRLVAHVTAYDFYAQLLQHALTRMLQSGRVVWVEVVEGDHLDAVAVQPFGQVEAHETCAARDQHHAQRRELRGGAGSNPVTVRARRES